MKQIYVGSTQRSKIFNKLRNTLRGVHLVQIVILGLLVIIPIVFAEKFFQKKRMQLSPVVYIETPSGSGSAVYVGNNYFITAAHVVDDLKINDDLDLEFRNPNDETDNLPAKAKLIVMGDFSEKAESPNEDYALLSLQNMNADDVIDAYLIMEDENAIDMNNDADIEVKAIGYPNGTYSSTSGKISNKQGGAIETAYKKLIRMVLEKEMSKKDANILAEEYVKKFVNKSDFFVVTGAKIWHGNSGGALVHVKTNTLIGITNIEFTDVNTHQQNANLNVDDQTFVLKIGAIKKGLKAKGFNI